MCIFISSTKVISCTPHDMFVSREKFAERFVCFFCLYFENDSNSFLLVRDTVAYRKNLYFRFFFEFLTSKGY